MKSAVCRKIKEYRIRKGVTQETVAQAVYCSQQSIARYEKDQVPDLDTLIRLADFFHVSLDELAGRKYPVTDTLEEVTIL